MSSVDKVDLCWFLQSKPGAYTEFRVRVQDDRTIMFEAVKNALQFLTFNESGKIGDTRGILDKEPIRRFHVYCKVCGF